MRLWSIHPKYLDNIGLVALWREGLLAQKVIEGKTRGYRNHPQLIRFKNYPDSLLAIGTYLYHVFLEGKKRKFNFDLGKIKEYDTLLERIISVTKGQVEYEYRLLLSKLNRRNPERYNEIKDETCVEVNPIFYLVAGATEKWEKTKFIISELYYMRGC